MDTLHPALAPGADVGVESDDYALTSTKAPAHGLACPEHPDEYLDVCVPDELDGSRLVGVCHLCPMGHWFVITYDEHTDTHVNHGRLYHGPEWAVSPAA